MENGNGWLESIARTTLDPSLRPHWTVKRSEVLENSLPFLHPIVSQSTTATTLGLE
jgi:hypothetical protein